ncbi:MAG: toxin-antitoxin system HicB family antitoxin [Chloroflexi bacterium]|nr:toxin-antitoxin system HicB family antitoxin [Chloroflexota bacterium]
METKQGRKLKQNIRMDLAYYMSLPYNIIVEQWDDGDGTYWVARVVELPHCLIHGSSPEEAVREIQEVKRDWIRSNLERGLTIPEPISHKYSGQIRLRIPPALHKLLSNRSEAEEISLNQYMNTALALVVGYPVKPPKRKGKPGPPKVALPC